MGLDADELQNVTKGGQLAAMSAQALIVELIARFLAEGLRHIFLKIHSRVDASPGQTARVPDCR